MTYTKLSRILRQISVRDTHRRVELARSIKVMIVRCQTAVERTRVAIYGSLSTLHSTLHNQRTLLSIGAPARVTASLGWCRPPFPCRELHEPWSRSCRIRAFDPPDPSRPRPCRSAYCRSPLLFARLPKRARCPPGARPSWASNSAKIANSKSLGTKQMIYQKKKSTRPCLAHARAHTHCNLGKLLTVFRAPSG